jgi:hypothetical protein
MMAVGLMFRIINSEVDCFSVFIIRGMLCMMWISVERGHDTSVTN